MNDPFQPKSPVTVYLTREQIYRCAGLANDALVGMQITTDASDETSCTIDMVHIDSQFGTKHYIITGDGTIEDVT